MSNNITDGGRMTIQCNYVDEELEFNCVVNGDLQSYLERRMGYSRLPDNELIPITIVYSILFLTGMIGNAITIYVISSVRYMRTATNLYLINLAVTDILSLTLSMTHELITFWIYYPYPFNSTVCKLRTLIAESATTATVLTIMAVTIERYIAICQPLLINSSESSKSLRRSVKVIITIWICACLAAIPVTLQLDVMYLESPFENGTIIPESAACRISKLKEGESDSADSSDRIWLISFITFFVVPLTVITVLYLLIGRAIRRAEDRYHKSDIAKIHAAAYRRSQDDRCTMNIGLGASAPSTTIATCVLPSCTDSRILKQKVKARRGVVRMLVAVVVGFFVCWAPYNVERLVTILAPKGSFNDETFSTVHRHFFFISGVLFYVSSTINPLLYVVSSAKFRRATKVTLRMLIDGCTCKQQSPTAAFHRPARNNRANQVNKNTKNQHLLRARGRFRSLCGSTRRIRLPHAIESYVHSEPLIRNPQIQVSPMVCTMGSRNVVYHDSQYPYRYSPANYASPFHEQIETGRSNPNYLMTPRTGSYQKRSQSSERSGGGSNQFLSAFRGALASEKSDKRHSSLGGKSKKKKRGEELQRDCVSLGALELNSRYLGVGSVSHNSSSDSSERRPCTLT